MNKNITKSQVNEKKKKKSKYLEEKSMKKSLSTDKIQKSNKKIKSKSKSKISKEENKKIQEQPKRMDLLIQKQSGNESDHSDSEDEQVLSRIGRVPLKWYENYKHLGYDLNAEKVIKKEQVGKIQEFIDKEENPNWWRTVKDAVNNTEIVLTDKDLEILERVRRGQFADKTIQEQDYSFEYDWHEGMFPLSGKPEPKRHFLPSKHEEKMVNKIVTAIKLGRIKLDDKYKITEEQFFDIWQQENQNKYLLPPITAPKLKLPTHAESYNPSEEYLFDENEKKEWEEMDEDDREQNFMPKKYDCLRKVEAYEKFIQERFDRCLDLYLCPRVQKKKLNIDPEVLIPNLPKPQELRPFPTLKNINFSGHEARVRAISVFPNGQYLASCDEAGVLIIWEVATSRIMKKYQFEGKNYCVKWQPLQNHGILALCNEDKLILLNIDILPEINQTNNSLTFQESQENALKNFDTIKEWKYFSENSQEYKNNQRIQIDSINDITYCSFHSKGDYILTVSPKAEKKNEQVLIHQISTSITQKPFSKSKGDIIRAVFHPLKPYIFLLTKKTIFVYNLQKQELMKKLSSSLQLNSCLSVHPKGDNLIVGSFDRRVCWFDLELGSKPYKTLRYHEKDVREVKFHPKYPLFATCSDDCTVNIFHGEVFNDLMKNALIVPVKVLKGHEANGNLGVLDIEFHPTQPWIFSAGADHEIYLWT